MKHAPPVLADYSTFTNFLKIFDTFFTFFNIYKFLFDAFRIVSTAENRSQRWRTPASGRGAILSSIGCHGNRWQVSYVLLCQLIIIVVIIAKSHQAMQTIQRNSRPKFT